MLLRLTGDCTVGRAEEIRAMLLEALRAGGDIELDFADVMAMDLSFGQLLHALRRACEARGVELRLGSNLPQGLADQAVCCGLPCIAGLGGPETVLNIGVVR